MEKRFEQMDFGIAEDPDAQVDWDVLAGAREGGKAPILIQCACKESGRD